ncbi:MAG TPA: hypothetical protein PLW02_00580 [Verrucomicrobiota bacterium]|nr:hypothetical protein [Verrucomicrobiota bacterium]
MKTLFTLLVLTVFILCGCGKKSDAESKSQQTNFSSGNPVTAPADYLGAVGKAKKYSDKTIDLVNIKKAIKDFEANEGRLPKDLTELVKGKYLPSIPKPPTGMRIEYDAKTGDVKIVAENK